MAKVLYGQGVSKYSGKLGGTVFANNRAGSYARNFVVPVNPKTSYQVAQRNRIAQFSGDWRSLSSGEQDAWATWAAAHPVIDRLGNSIQLSGHQAFVGANTLRSLAGDDADTVTVPGDPSYTANAIKTAFKTLDVSSTKIEVEAMNAIAASTVWFCYSAPPVSPGVSYVFDKEKLVHVETVAAPILADAVLVDLFAEVALRFGSLTEAAGKKQIIRVMQYSEGQLSNPYVIQGIWVT